MPQLDKSIEIKDEEILIKFPISLKESFEKSVSIRGYWDHNEKIRKISTQQAEILSLYNFAKANNFIISKDFDRLQKQVQQIYDQREFFEFQSQIVNGEVKLINTDTDTLEWWEKHRVGQISDDLLLAKSMGFIFNRPPTNIAESIAASESTQFWIKDISRFIDLVKTTNGTVCLLIDRFSKSFEWLKTFVEAAQRQKISTADIKICFREDKDQDSGLNQWIRDQNLGGPVNQGRLLIFNHRPAKWLFKNEINVNIIASNSLYPSVDQTTKDWIRYHRCVIYLGEIRPASNPGQTIVEL